MGTLTSWNHLGHSRSVTGLLYLYLLLLGYKPVQHCTVLNTLGNCNTMVSIIILYYNIIILWGHCRVWGPSLTETSSCGEYLYLRDFRLPPQRSWGLCSSEVLNEAHVCSWLQTFRDNLWVQSSAWHLKLGLIFCPEKPMTKYQPTPPDIPEGRRFFQMSVIRATKSSSTNYANWVTFTMCILNVPCSNSRFLQEPSRKFGYICFRAL
jgi:hypothetical protein